MMMISERDELLQMYSDVHKDAYGFRPRDYDRVKALSLDELRAEMDYLGKVAMEEYEREQAAEKEAAFNLGVAVEALAQDQGVSVGTAWRWMMQAEDLENDLEHFLWRQGVGCGETARELAQEIREVL